jgi:RNA polymerase sigma-70 factor (ECF subfamily)
MDESRNKEKDVQLAVSQPTPPNPQADLERVFQEHQQRVLRAAYRVTGSLDDAQDVLQTVFLRLVRREGGQHLSDSPGSYLHRAAINASLDLVRARQSAKATALEKVEPTLAGSPEENPDRQQGSNEIRDVIRAALAKMSPRAAEVFTLRYFEGYGNHEIAKLLGTSRSTINVILHRTRSKLRDEIAPYAALGTRTDSDSVDPLEKNHE